MNRRVLEPIETHIMTPAALLLLTLSIIFAAFPALLAYPVSIVLLWFAMSLLCRGYKLRRTGKLHTDSPTVT
jgi:uncharacterized membrane protein